ncbi:hypothetical protein KXD40_006412 [Peronospora effusa]|uniref:Uncharacterized protein n=1 Tax=Peronospora effusa TaxID=542832 RepID=A0A3M6V776_9STRA|nr:hypothetical protein DD238_007691 [Peronospora effusa]RQM16980.1 hypothetical protein DD237_001471 [Peronospora effusa]UIZ25497.1 hypothetical protein KXD40_006412 [Peronospora effusa]CAI5706449.1 unnamed protein product [Peronospora effusa]
MKVEAREEDNGMNATMASMSPGKTALAEMNAAFASCLSLVCPPIQYPPHCRFNPVRDAADTAEIEARLEEFFLHAKQLEQLFLNETVSFSSSMNVDESMDDTEVDTERSEAVGGRQQQSELELEILNLEAELAEKNDLIEKYTDVREQIADVL